MHDCRHLLMLDKEPTFRSSEMNITIDVDHGALSPGYFWLTPYAGDFRFGSYGPQIFDNEGVRLKRSIHRDKS